MKFKCLCLAIITLFIVLDKPATATNIDPPDSLNATAVSSSRIDLTWRDNATNEKGFEIERYTSSSGSWSRIATLGANARSYANTGLSASTTYYYRVRAYNSAGNSSYSNTADATTQSGLTTPAAPSSLTAGAVSSSQINLSWQDNASNETGFKIERYTSSSGSWSQIATLGANARSYTNTGLSASTTYYYRVRAYNSAGNSSYSNTASATTQSGVTTTPAAPSSLTAGAVSSSQINLSWQDHAGNESGFHIWRYDSSWKQIAIVGANRTTYSDTGLSAATTCQYAVRAYNSAGTSSWSNVVSATTSSGGVTLPAAPSSLTAGAVSASQINLSWQDRAGNESGFKVERATAANGPWSQIATVAANVRSYANAGLSASRTYYYRVRAYNTAGNSSYSNTAGATTPAAADTTTPSVSITSPQSGTTYTSAQTVTITAAASDNVGVVKVELYQNGVLRRIDTSAPYSHSWAVTSADNRSHSWWAKAYDAAGNSRISTTVSLTVNIGTASSGEHLWSQRFGGSRNDKGYSVAVDDLSGDVVLTGQFYGSVDFGGGTLPCAGSVNMVVARYTAEGTHLWSQCAEGVTGSVVGNAVAVDETTGDVVVTGSFTDTADFDGWSLTSDGMNDIFVAKYDGAGELQWVEQSGGYSDDRGRGIAVDSSGEVVVTGFFQNPDAIFVAKYTPEGVLLWLKRFTGYGTNMGQAITVDAADNIVVAGNFFGTVDFGGGPLTSASSWFPDVFVAKYSVNGEHIWSQRFGSNGEEFAYGVAVDSSGDIALIGSFTGTFDFGGPALTSAGSYDIFVAKLRGSNGGHQWSRRFGEMGNEIGTGVAIDESGDIVLIGSFTGTVDFGGPALTSNGGNDVFVTKYSAGGGHVWSKGFGGSWADSAAGVAVNAGGDLSLTGCFTGTVDFGGGQLTGEGYYYDIFLVNIAP